MADTLYAWSPIRSAESKEGAELITIKVGEKVTQADLKVDDDEWAYLVQSGAVRTMKYPDMGNAQESPVNFLMQQAKKAADALAYDAEQSAEAMDAAMHQVNAATGVETVVTADPELDNPPKEDKGK